MFWIISFPYPTPLQVPRSPAGSVGLDEITSLGTGYPCWNQLEYNPVHECLGLPAVGKLKTHRPRSKDFHARTPEDHNAANSRKERQPLGLVHVTRAYNIFTLTICRPLEDTAGHTQSLPSINRDSRRQWKRIPATSRRFHNFSMRYAPK